MAASSGASRTVLGLCGLLAAALALATPLIAASRDLAYDPCASFISELGARGAPHAVLVGFGGFLPTGLFALGFCALGIRVHGSRLGFLSFSAVGLAYVVAAFFPCEPGCPVSGGPAQRVHNLFGGLEYVGGGAALAAFCARGAGLPRWSRAWAGVAAALVLLSFALMVQPDEAARRGLWQRLAEASLFGWMASLSLWHLRPARRTDAS